MPEQECQCCAKVAEVLGLEKDASSETIIERVSNVVLIAAKEMGTRLPPVNHQGTVTGRLNCHGIPPALQNVPPPKGPIKDRCSIGTAPMNPTGMTGIPHCMETGPAGPPGPTGADGCTRIVDGHCTCPAGSPGSHSESLTGATGDVGADGRVRGIRGRLMQRKEGSSEHKQEEGGEQHRSEVGTPSDAGHEG